VRFDCGACGAGQSWLVRKAKWFAKTRINWWGPGQRGTSVARISLKTRARRSYECALIPTKQQARAWERDGHKADSTANMSYYDIDSILTDAEVSIPCPLPVSPGSDRVRLENSLYISVGRP
jgi:hypothetical protein